METFKVYITFTGGGGTHVETHTDETLKGAILRLITGPAVVMGMIGGIARRSPNLNEEILFALLDAFFRKIIGLEYWENYIKQHHQTAYDHSTNQERERVKDLESKGVENPEKEVYPIKIYFNRMVDFRDMMSELHKHPNKHKKYLDPTFADSVEFLEEYDGKLNILIEKLFFIMKKGEKQPNRSEHLVKWVTISDQVRDEPSHKRDHPYLVDQERKAFDEIDPKIQNLLKKLSKFVGV